MDVGLHEADIGQPHNRRPITELLDKASLERELGDVRKQNENLTDIVRRLTTELNRYHSKYPPVADSAVDSVGITKDEAIPPWLSNSQHISPLFAAYDDRIMELEENVRFYKEELHNIHISVRKLTDENTRLRSDLQRTMDLRISEAEELETRMSLNQDKMGPGSNGGSHDPHEWMELQERLELLTAENDTLVEQRQTMEHEVDRQQQEIEARTREYIEVSKQLKQSVDRIAELEQTSYNLTTELEDLERTHASTLSKCQNAEQRKGELSSELNQVKKDLQSHIQTSLSDKKTLEEALLRFRQHAEQLTSEKQAWQVKDSDMTRALRRLEEALNGERSQHANAARERDQARDDLADALRTISGLEQKIYSSEKRASDAERKTKEAVDLVNEAHITRDQTKAREETLKKEISRLTEKLVLQGSEMQSRSDAVIQSIRMQQDQMEAKYFEEIQQLETKIAESQQNVVKLQREMRSLEEEKVAMQEHMANEQKRFHQSTTELIERESRAQQQSEEAKFHRDSALADADTAKKDLAVERIRLGDEIKKYQQSLHDSRKENKRVESDCTRLANVAAECRAKIQSLEADKKALNDTIMKEKKDCAERMDELSNSLRGQINEAQATIRRLEQDIEDTRRISCETENKLRDESRRERSRLEKMITETREEADRMCERNNDLEHRLSTLLVTESEYQQKMKDAQKSIENLRTMAATAENRANDAYAQLSNLRTTEANSYREIQDIHNKCERYKLDKERLEGDLRQAEQRLREAAHPRSTGGLAAPMSSGYAPGDVGHVKQLQELTEQAYLEQLKKASLSKQKKKAKKPSSS